MTINEYQTEALRTAAGMNHPNNDEILLNGVMGLCGESGECVDMVKKYRFQGHELDNEFYEDMMKRQMASLSRAKNRY